jgi:hypothetical protein
VQTLRLTQSPDVGGHRVEVALEAPGRARRTASAQVAVEVAAGDQELIRWYLEDYSQVAADVVTAGIAGRAERLLSDLGGQLFRALFDATPGTRALWEAVRPGLGSTRVEIVTNVAGATAVPWELLRDPETGQAIALQAAALVRAHPRAAQAPHLPASEADGLRVLLVISRPGAVDVAFRSVASRLARLQAGEDSALQLDVLRPPGFARLATVLHVARDAGTPYHVVHFDGHGVWADPAGEGWLRDSALSAAGWSLVSPPRPGAHGYLLFEDPQRPGWLQLADGPALGRLLADAGVPLLVLNACRSAHADSPAAPRMGAADLHERIRAYGSLAQEVMDAGVTGVVAMRYNIYVGTAARFTADVYDGLLAGRPLGIAVTAARRHLAESPAGDPGVPVQDWTVPVAYEAASLHLVDGAARRDRILIRPAMPGGGLPAPPDLGFFGRDETLLALDRAFGGQPVVLLHGEAGIGKTAVAAEFGRWYQRTGGVRGPVLYTSLGQLPTLATLAGELAAAFAVDLAALGLSWGQLPDGQRRQVVGQIIRQRPLLWIWDGLLPSAAPTHLAGRSDGGQQELLAFLRSARDTRAKILLLSRSDEQDRLGDLPVRIPLPPMPPSESSLLVRAAAASNGLDLTSPGPSSAALTALGGNPRAIMDLTGRAIRAGCTTGDELSDYVVQAAARQE